MADSVKGFREINNYYTVLK